MNQLRKDYFLDRWVIIAENRGKRPQQFAQKKESRKVETCFFCPGNEKLTPPEIDRVEKNGKWIMRCFPNKFSATQEGGAIGLQGEAPFVYRTAKGFHEIIVETEEHEKELEDLSLEHMAQVFGMYRKRYEELIERDGIEYVCIFKNRGREGGASLVHSHTQLIALPVVPPLIEEEAKAHEKECPFCKLIGLESKGERRIAENETAVCFAPYASRFPFEVWFVPKRHIRTLGDMEEKEVKGLVSLLKGVLGKLDSSLNYPPYNYVLHMSPKEGNLHFHIELLPRLATWAGFELETNIIINTLPPEVAAKHLRGS